MNLKQIGSNQTQIETETAVILFSYNTPVAYEDKKTVKFFKTSKFWSRTTSKHINAWLGDCPAKLVDQKVLDGLAI